MRLSVFTHTAYLQWTATLTDLADLNVWSGDELADGSHHRHPHCDPSMNLVKTDLVHRLFSELPQSVQDVATRLNLIVHDVSVPARDTGYVSEGAWMPHSSLQLGLTSGTNHC